MSTYHEAFREVAPGVNVGNGEIVVCGMPHETEDETDPRFHNCDAMGCGYEHVLFRARLAPPDQGTT